MDSQMLGQRSQGVQTYYNLDFFGFTIHPNQSILKKIVQKCVKTGWVENRKKLCQTKKYLLNREHCYCSSIAEGSSQALDSPSTVWCILRFWLGIFIKLNSHNS